MDGSAVANATTLAFIAAFITAIIEVIKAWIPKKYKDEAGLIIPYAREGKHIHIPNQAVWPTLSMAIGMAIFLVLELNVFGNEIDTTAGAAITGGATAIGSNAFFRLKTKAGNLFGGNDATNAQNTGPAMIASALADITGTPVDASVLAAIATEDAAATAVDAAQAVAATAPSEPPAIGETSPS
jgi:hypothetical protein